jgi:acyl dehydratase
MNELCYYDDFNVGDEFITVRRTITESDVMSFAGLSGDFNPLHTDQVFAETTIYGQRIAHGLIGLAISTGLKQRLGVFDGTVIGFLGAEWNFRKPLLIGDTVHCRILIEDMRLTKNPTRGIVRQKVELINQANELVQEGVHTVMLKTRLYDKQEVKAGK